MTERMHSGIVGSVAGVLLSLAAVASAQEFAFERLWPTLPQPWYFDSPSGIAVDAVSNVYVADFSNNRVLKFTAEGRLITELDFGGENVLPKDVEIDAEGAVYVLDFFKRRVAKFSSTGDAILIWDDHSGANEGELDSPQGMAVGSDGAIFIADRETHRVEKFTNGGEFLLGWGGQGAGEGQFNEPFDVATISSTEIVVSDSGNSRLEVFTPDGVFVRAWSTLDAGIASPKGIEIIASAEESGPEILVAGFTAVARYDAAGTLLDAWGVRGSADGELRLASYVAYDTDRGVYLSDAFANRVQRFTLQGKFIQKWSAEGVAPGYFIRPQAIATSSAGDVFVADTGNGRIQRFEAEGNAVLSFGEAGPNPLSGPIAMDIDGADRIFVADINRREVLRYTTGGDFVDAWGSQGEEPGEFDFLVSVAVNSEGVVYTADSTLDRVQLFDSDGQFIAMWGPDADVADVVYPFDSPRAIAIDSNDNVFVADLLIGADYHIHKFTADGMFLFDLGPSGSDPGEVGVITGMTIDSEGNLYAAEPFRPRLQVFGPLGEFIADLSSEGSGPGQFNEVYDVALGPENRVYTVENANHRVQSFFLADSLPNNKAIIVSSSVTDDFDDDARFRGVVQASANLAYQALQLQGYTKESVYFINDNPNFDLDLNGLPDDVDGVPTYETLQYAITEWADGADNLILYMIGGASSSLFALREFDIKVGVTELIFYFSINQFLDTQSDIPGAVMVLIDASDSGSALTSLKAEPGQRRIVISSTLDREPAYFLSQGALSFSNYFWIQVFNGQNALDAFETARSAMATAVDYQSPQLDDDGSGVGNEVGDGAIASAANFFNLTPQNAVAPRLSGVSPPQIIASDETSASFFVDDIADDTGLLNRVWGVVTPPDNGPVPTKGDDELTQAVLDLPEFELQETEDGRYEGAFDSFDATGKYFIDFFAQDDTLAVSEGKRTTVEKSIVPSNLVVSVYDAETNEPILDAAVYIGALQIDPYHTGESGLIVIASPALGTYEIRVEVEGYASQTQTVTIEGAGIETVAFRMGAPSRAGCAAGGRGSASPGDGIVIGMVAVAAMLARSGKNRRRIQ